MNATTTGFKTGAFDRTDQKLEKRKKAEEGRLDNRSFFAGHDKAVARTYVSQSAAYAHDLFGGRSSVEIKNEYTGGYDGD